MYQQDYIPLSSDKQQKTRTLSSFNAPPVEELLPFKRRRRSLFDASPQDMSELQYQVFPQLKSNSNSFDQIIDPKKIYVGNIPLSVSEKEIVDFFNSNMKKLLRKEDVNPVLKAEISNEKTSCSLEFSDEKDVQVALKNLEGIKFLEEKLTLRPMKKPEAGGGALYTSLVPTESPNKLFIGGLPSEMLEDQVKDLLTYFGELKQFNLVMDSVTNLSKGYAFCEYLNEDITDKVIQQLNGKEIGSKTLLVQRASVSSKQTQNTMIMSVDFNSSVSALLNLNIKCEAALASLVATRSLSMLPTRILVLYNMFREEDYDLNEDDYRDLYDDIKMEVKKFGRVKALVIPRERKEGKQDKVIIKPGKVFVCYDTVEQAEKAQAEFAARRFQGRIILTSYFPNELFENRDYYPKN
eukprot:gene12210-5797_t